MTTWAAKEAPQRPMPSPNRAAYFSTGGPPKPVRSPGILLHDTQPNYL